MPRFVQSTGRIGSDCCCVSLCGRDRASCWRRVDVWVSLVVVDFGFEPGCCCCTTAVVYLSNMNCGSSVPTTAVLCCTAVDKEPCSQHTPTCRSPLARLITHNSTCLFDVYSRSKLISFAILCAVLRRHCVQHLKAPYHRGSSVPTATSVPPRRLHC